MESVILSKEHLLILGDFNINLDVSDDAVKFHDLLESLGIEQHVTKSAHIHGHILDLVITCKTENIPLSFHFHHAAVVISLIIHQFTLTLP